MTAPYTQTTVVGASPGGTGDGTWTFAIPPQGEAWEGATLKFSIEATDGDLSPVASMNDNEGNYFTVAVAAPNQVPYTPHAPDPADGASNVPLTHTLSWQGGDPDGDPVAYTVALGDSDPPSFAATTVLTGYDPGGLITGTTYYWVVTATDGISTSVGPTWSFTTSVGLEYKYIYLPLILRDH